MPKILIFDNDAFLREIYGTKFRLEGFEVADYNNPSRDPVSLVLKEHPDIISMDILMPDVDGFMATELIKNDPRTKNIPLFFLTNISQSVDRQKGMKLGAAEYFIKAEVTPDDLVNHVKRLIGLPHQVVETTRERVKKGRRFLDRLLGRKK